MGRGRQHQPQIMPYAEKLDIAHKRGLVGIETGIERIEWEDREKGKVAMVICNATVRMMEDGIEKTYKAHGDASPYEIQRGRQIGAGTPAFDTPIRMAETRAKSRALSDAINRGEEVDHESHEGHEAAEVVSMPERAPTPKAPQQQPPQAPVGVGVERGAAKGVPEAPAGKRPNRSEQPARKSQVDLLKTLAEELRGAEGVPRLEQRIGKKLSDLTRAEADQWIDKLHPQPE